jgi:natural product precursor
VKKTDKNVIKKLQLNKELIRVLTDTELSHVVGGAGAPCAGRETRHSKETNATC